MSDTTNELTHLQALLDAAVDAIITIDAAGVIRSVNLSTCSLFGYDESELLGRNVATLMPDPWASEHDSYLRRYEETGEARIIGKGRGGAGPAQERIAVFRCIFRSVASPMAARCSIAASFTI